MVKIYHVGHKEPFWVEDMFVAVDRIPVGYCRLTIKKKGVCTTDVYVDKTHRGRGIGHRLKATAIEYGFAHGAKEFRVAVYKGNNSSLANCISHGYKIYEKFSDKEAWHLRLKKGEYRP